MWVTQEGEGQQTLRVCHMSDSPSLLTTGSLVISSVVTFTHQALATSGSVAGLGLSPSEKGYGLGFLLCSPSDVLQEPAGCCHLGVPGCSVQP